MPLRFQPRAAFTYALWAVMLIAAEGILCAQLARQPHRPIPAPLSCVTIRGDRWNLLPGVEYTGRLKIELAPAARGTMLLLVGDALPVDLEMQTEGGARVPFAHELVHATATPTDFWLEYGNPWQAPPHVLEARVESRIDRPRTLMVNLGRRAPRVLARLSGYPDAARGRVCAAPPAAGTAFDRSDTLTVTPWSTEYFATGWSGIVAVPGNPIRWMGEHGVMLVPSSRDGTVNVRLRAEPAAAGNEDPPQLRLSVNDVFHTALTPMRDGLSTYEWVVPATAWVTGTNELLFTVTRTAYLRDRIAAGGQSVGLRFQRLDLTVQ